MANLLADFKGIQVTLAVAAQALIVGRIDCKTAGRLLVQLQTMSKLLWMLKKTKMLPQKNTDKTDLKKLMVENTATNERDKTQERLPLINTDHTDPKKLRAARNLIANERERTRIGLVLPRVRTENAEWKSRAENIGLRRGESGMTIRTQAGKFSGLKRRRSQIKLGRMARHNRKQHEVTGESLNASTEAADC